MNPEQGGPDQSQVGQPPKKNVVPSRRAAIKAAGLGTLALMLLGLPEKLASAEAEVTPEKNTAPYPPLTPEKTKRITMGSARPRLVPETKRPIETDFRGYPWFQMENAVWRATGEPLNQPYGFTLANLQLTDRGWFPHPNDTKGWVYQEEMDLNWPHGQYHTRPDVLFVHNFGFKPNFEGMEDKRLVRLPSVEEVGEEKAGRVKLFKGITSSTMPDGSLGPPVGGGEYIEFIVVKVVENVPVETEHELLAAAGKDGLYPIITCFPYEADDPNNPPNHRVVHYLRPLGRGNDLSGQKTSNILEARP